MSFSQCNFKQAVIIAVMNAIYEFRLEARKSRTFNGVWTRYLAIPLRHSNHLWAMKLTNWAMKLWSWLPELWSWRGAKARNVSFSISVRWSIYIINSADKPKFRVSLPHRHSTTVSLETNPLYSYEATDAGSWSFVGSNKPVSSECKVIFKKCHILNCEFSNQVSYDHRSYERNISNCV